MARPSAARQASPSRHRFEISRDGLPPRLANETTTQNYDTKERMWRLVFESDVLCRR
jgi:hypothetical protein